MQPHLRSNNRLHFTLSGPDQIVAVDNGDPTSFESFQAPERNAFNGLCLVVFRTKAGQPGEVKLKAQSEGLAGVDLVVWGMGGQRRSWYGCACHPKWAP
jgi:beta-galactosidase